MSPESAAGPSDSKTNDFDDFDIRAPAYVVPLSLVCFSSLILIQHSDQGFLGLRHLGVPRYRHPQSAVIAKCCSKRRTESFGQFLPNSDDMRAQCFAIVNKQRQEQR